MAQSGHGADIGAMKQIADQTAARDHSGVDIIAKRAVEYVPPMKTAIPGLLI